MNTEMKARFESVATLRWKEFVLRKGRASRAICPTHPVQLRYPIE